MKNFIKKGIPRKIIIGIITILMFNFIVPNYSRADAGGVILSPLVDLVATLGDVIINLLQKSMTGDFGTKNITKWSLSGFLVEGDTFFSDPKNLPDVDKTISGESVDPDSEFDKGWLGIKDEYYIPVATYSPEQIFSNKVPGLDINFINPNYSVSEKGSAAQLQTTIATWYVALRNLAVVGLLSILVYVGIRIVLSSTAGDKAKYKQLFTDWLVALCLLFFLHYIMSFVLTMTESITDAIGGDGATGITINVQGKGDFTTNLLGEARFKTQYKDIGPKITYLMLYIILVGYTCIFTWMYLKRMLMMAFLTIIAPLVALTYPIDKMNDGKAQAFDTWLKEYVYNALLQPFHLIIYIVFVGSAMDLVSENKIYAIAAIGFILPAEKILRNIFGFNKASAGTVGALTGFTAGSMASKFFNKGNKGGRNKTIKRWRRRK